PASEPRLSARPPQGAPDLAPEGKKPASTRNRAATSAVGGINVDEATLGFGQAALDLKLATGQQLREAMLIKRAYEQSSGRVPTLGDILITLGFINRDQMTRILRHQEIFGIATKIPGFTIVEKIGQGAMGTVYKAKQVRLDRWVAIKILSPELAANEKARTRFIAEARVAARLNHPNIITGIDAGEVEDLCYFAMEYVEGETVQRLIEQRGPFDEMIALTIVSQIAQALDHASTHSLVHRDIKPDNIMLNKEQNAKLLDLGLAKIMLGDRPSSDTQGMAVGTPNYISPEQAMGWSEIDIRADIYSLGGTFYTMLTGQTPYTGPSQVVMYRHIHEPPPDVRAIRSDVSQFTVDLCAWMMAKQREYRPQSPRHLLDRLNEALGMSQGNASSHSAMNAPAHLQQSSGQVPAYPYGQPQQQEFQQSQQEQADPRRLPRKRRRNYGAGW
ncbi:MAG: serine/threonine protein kinase, partial [Planctomycetaceae bacterium]|nr:serine/threonine protein kinase [Planctomycetaceae bacterium]